MKSRCLAALAVALLVAGCGQSHATPKPPPVAHCEPADYAMQCVQAAAPVSGALQALAPPVARGIDFAWGPPSAAWMRSQGYAFGASYLSYDPSKDWSRSLVDSFAARGIARVFVWETSATRALGGCGAGESDARAARSMAAPFHARVIYFAVDFELSRTATVESYFRCTARVLGVTHTGAYGGYTTIKALFDSHLIRYGWQTSAWSGGRLDGRAQLYQYLNGSAFDYDRALAADYGQTPFTAVKRRDRRAEHRHLKALYVERHKIRVHLLNAGCRVKSPRSACHPLFVRGRDVNREIRVFKARGVK